MSMTLFLPGQGTLAARLTGALQDDPATGLVYDMTIPVRHGMDVPPEARQAYPQQTEVRLDLIRIGLGDWRNLPGQAFTFPVNPEPGYVDGSVYFGDTHQYVDLTRLRFDGLSGSTLTATATLTFNFYADSALPDLPATMTVDWALALAVDAPALDKVIKEARALAGLPR